VAAPDVLRLTLYHYWILVGQDWLQVLAQRRQPGSKEPMRSYPAGIE
jgi:hypothetical protein